MISYLSVCSGIEAASVAWKPLGWEAVAFAEVEAFSCSVLAHHYPETPNWGDMTKWKEWPDAAVDLLVGGTPCQSFSVAGLRGGLNDPRGGLMLQFLAIADRYRPRWIVWENVPGVLSSNGGRDFGTFLGALGELGYGWAYRVLDAQWFGVAQRRRRVFVVGCLGDQRSAAKVLFERESVRRDNPPRREAGEGVAGNAGDGAAAGGSWWDGGQVSQTLDAVLAKGQTMPEKNRFPAVLVPAPIVLMDQGGSVMGTLTDGTVGTLRREMHGHEPVIAFSPNMSFPSAQVDLSPCLKLGGHGGGNPPAIVFAGSGKEDRQTADGVCMTLKARMGTGGGNVPVIAFAQNQLGEVRTGEVANTINTNSNASGRNTPMVAFKAKAGMEFPSPGDTGETSPALQSQNQMAVAIGTDCYNGAITGDVAATIGTPGSSVNASGPTVMQSMQVRRLTPEECEKLMGFPPGYTQVPHRGKPAADGPRYKALGNSMAVPCMAWIGRRIQMREEQA